MSRISRFLSARPFAECMPLRVVAFLLLVGLLGSYRGLLASGPSFPVPLNPENPAQARIGMLDYRGGLVLGMPDSDFGGLSGLEVDPDGSRVVALSDRGTIVTAKLDHDENHRLHAVHDMALHDLVDERDGGRVSGWRGDSEGLARRPDGRWMVSFERKHRMVLYEDDGGIPGKPLSSMGRPPGFAPAPRNAGIEALTVMADGRVFAIREAVDESSGGHQAWVCNDDGACDTFEYRARDPYLPTGATTLPGGDLLILERRASVLGGFGVRIVRVPCEEVQGGAVVTGLELARIEPPLTVDNFEGISAIPSPEGGADIYLVSDDNFWALQRTLLMKFHLAD